MKFIPQSHIFAVPWHRQGIAADVLTITELVTTTRKDKRWGFRGGGTELGKLGHAGG